MLLKGKSFFAVKGLRAYYRDRALIALRMAITDTPTSANTASHMVARAEARSNPNLKEECGVSEYEGG